MTIKAGDVRPYKHKTVAGYPSVAMRVMEVEGDTIKCLPVDVAIEREERLTYSRADFERWYPGFSP